MSLLLNMTDLLIAIKKAAKEAIESGQPTDFCFGKVTSISPLKILVEQKMTLGVAQLVLSRNVTDYETDITMEWETENSKEPTIHKHQIKGQKKLIIHNALKVGDEVILLKQYGGQKYLVLDRVVKL